MSDGGWYKERLAEEYFRYASELQEDSKGKVLALVQGDDGVYRPTTQENTKNGMGE